MDIISTNTSGLRRLYYHDADGGRRILYLGKIPKKQAETILSHVEGIVSAQAAKDSTPMETSIWLGGIGDKLYAKLVKQGLVTARQATLEKQIDTEQRKDDLGPFLRITSPSEQTLSAEPNGSTNTLSET